MEGWQQILEAYPWLRTLWDALRVMAPLSALLAFTGLLYISATAKIIGVLRKRSAYGKCARQLAILALLLGWAILAGSRAWLYYAKDPAAAETLPNFMLELSWMLLSLGVLLSSIYFTLWKVLRNMPVLHATIGMISAIQNTLALGAILFTARLLSLPSPAAPGALSAPSLLPEQWDSPLWTACACTLPLLFGMAGSYGSCWLVMRRKRDDFGRDYYNAMLPWCVAWARNAWLVLWAIVASSICWRVWNEWHAGIFDQEAIVTDGLGAFLWFLPLVCWTIVCGSKIALRHRWLLFLGWLIAICFMLPYYLDIALA